MTTSGPKIAPATPWTAPQQAAIEHVAGDLLISAAAGSGKTAVLAQRCARLVCDVASQDGGCAVDGLLVLTFTDAAANEMRARIAQAIHARLNAPGTRSAEQTRWLQRQAAMVDRASISTLHAFCARVLRQHFHEVPQGQSGGIDPAFEVMDEDEARLLREEVLTDLLAAWHKPEIALRGNARLPSPQDFADFFEAYAQGRESNCREMIFAVHRMLESTDDPKACLAASRDRYTVAGCKTTLDLFARETVADQIRLLELAAHRGCDRIQSALGPCALLTNLQEAASQLAAAGALLAEKSCHAIPEIRSAFQGFNWPTIRAPKGDDRFAALREQTRDPIKAGMRKLCEDFLSLDPETMLRDLASLARPLDTLLALAKQFADAFTAAKRAQNRLDFADLERLTLNLLTAPHSLAAAELRHRYAHVLVDEFQDINPLQDALLKSVAQPPSAVSGGNLFVVGDVKQSIYGFRLADPTLFLEREKIARAAPAGARRHITLPHNFRSHPSLLTAMNAIFERLLTTEVAGLAYRQDGHALEPAPNSESKIQDSRLLAGSPVELHLVIMNQQDPEDDNDNGEESPAENVSPQENLTAVEEEARMVADRIASLIAEKRTIKSKDSGARPVQYRDVAVLLRTMKNKAMIFTRALARRGIPVHADLSTGYFDAPEVAATLDLLRVLDNPQQDIPLAGAMLGPYLQRFSHDDLGTIRLAYDRRAVPFHEAVIRYARQSLADRYKDAPPLDPALAARLAAFLETLAIWRAGLRTRPLHEGLANIYADAHIFPCLAGLDAGAQRVANLQALHQRALKFSSFRKQGLHRFLRFIEELQDLEADYGEAPVLSEASDVVRIMSIHKSKGLEFPVVFVSGLGNPFNLRENGNGGGVFVHRKLGIGLQIADVPRNIVYHSAASTNIVEDHKRSARAEELRLLYVALTRARDHLILTGHLAKADALDTARLLWRHHDGPLPEDVLLKARTPLDWLVPALACAHLKIPWPNSPEQAIANPQLTMTLHQPAGAPADGPECHVATDDPTVQRLLLAQPLPDMAPPPPQAEFDRLFSRITGSYAYDALADQPAVMSVTQLKKLEHAIDEEEGPAATFAFSRPDHAAMALEARARGIATHRVLELLDFACTPGSLDEHIEKLRQLNRLTLDEARIADREGIAWFLASPAGERLHSAARDKRFILRREIPFTWLAPAADHSLFTLPHSPLDRPTIRGVIDVLLVDRAAKNAEIFDYKTDSPFTWQNNLAGYTLQMRYYLQAAGDILGFPVRHATLLFLAARQSREITLP